MRHLILLHTIKRAIKFRNEIQMWRRRTLVTREDRSVERGDADDTCSATIWVGSHERRVSGCGRDGLPAGGSKGLLQQECDPGYQEGILFDRYIKIRSSQRQVRIDPDEVIKDQLTADEIKTESGQIQVREDQVRTDWIKAGHIRSS